MEAIAPCRSARTLTFGSDRRAPPGRHPQRRPSAPSAVPNSAPAHGSSTPCPAPFNRRRPAHPSAKCGGKDAKEHLESVLEERDSCSAGRKCCTRTVYLLESIPQWPVNGSPS
ncbi:hypothetical protein EJB05_04808, partial [Eragrostis curvula]